METPGLMPFVSEFLGQERGSTAAAIKEIKFSDLKKKNLNGRRCSGDPDAAKVNEALSSSFI